LLVLAFGILPKDLIINVEFVVFAMFLFVCASWFLILDKTERSIMHTFLKRGLSLVQRTFSA
jgi:hypothetical protein